MIGATATSASLSDADFGNQVKGCIEVHGVGPKCIVTDKPRDDSGEDSAINWKRVENVKNGMVVNTKWAVTEHDWQSPQVTIFSNDHPEDHVGAATSTDKLMSVERNFTEQLDSGLGSSANDPRGAPDALHRHNLGLTGWFFPGAPIPFFTTPACFPTPLCARCHAHVHPVEMISAIQMTSLHQTLVTTAAACGHQQELHARDQLHTYSTQKNGLQCG